MGRDEGAGGGWVWGAPVRGGAGGGRPGGGRGGGGGGGGTLAGETRQRHGNSPRSFPG